MNKLELDISKYSCQELKDIFDITPNVSGDQIHNHMNNFKSSAITDNMMNMKEKDNISKFIDQVVEKLSTSLDVSTFSNVDQTFSASQNNLLPETPENHPVIRNPNQLAGLNAKIYEGNSVNGNEYPPGYINPINVKTTKHQINIDTRFRASYYGSLSTNFHYDLPETFRKVVKMKIANFNIPLSIYSINATNNCFAIDSSNIDISYGNYSTRFTTKNTSQNDASGGLVTAINNSLLDSGITDISYGVDPVTGKSVFTSGSGGPYTFYFNRDCDLNDDLSTPLPLKLGWLLGFRAGVYSLPSGGTLTSEGIICVSVPRYVYLCINDYTTAGGNNFVALYNESTISPNIMARIQYQELVQKSGIYNYGQDDDTFEATREYFGPKKIKKLNLQILDEYYF